MILRRRRLSFAPVFIAGAMLAGVFAFPRLFFTFGHAFMAVVVGLVLAVFAFVLGTMVYLRARGRSLASGGIRIRYPGGFAEPALIGGGGHNAPLRLRETSDGFVVSESLWVTIPMLLGTGLFGPFMVFGVLRSPQMLHSPPPPIFAILGVGIVGLSCWFFAATLFKCLVVRPRLEVGRSGLRLVKYSRVVKTVDAVSVASRSFLYTINERLSTENFVFYATLRNGAETPLCITDKPGQRDRLKALFERAGYSSA